MRIVLCSFSIFIAAFLWQKPWTKVLALCRQDQNNTTRGPQHGPGPVYGPAGRRSSVGPSRRTARDDDGRDVASRTGPTCTAAEWPVTRTRRPSESYADRSRSLRCHFRPSLKTSDQKADFDHVGRRNADCGSSAKTFSDPYRCDSSY